MEAEALKNEPVTGSCLFLYHSLTAQSTEWSIWCTFTATKIFNVVIKVHTLPGGQICGLVWVWLRVSSSLPVSSSLMMSSRRLVPPVVAITFTPPMCLLTWMQIWLTCRASSLVGTMTKAGKIKDRTNSVSWTDQRHWAKLEILTQDSCLIFINLSALNTGGRARWLFETKDQVQQKRENYLVCSLFSGQCVQVREWGRLHSSLCRSWL